MRFGVKTTSPDTTRSARSCAPSSRYPTCSEWFPDASLAVKARLNHSNSCVLPALGITGASSPTHMKKESSDPVSSRVSSPSTTVVSLPAVMA